MRNGDEEPDRCNNCGGLKKPSSNRDIEQAPCECGKFKKAFTWNFPKRRTVLPASGIDDVTVVVSD